MSREVMFPKNARSYTHTTSPTWLPKQELGEDNSGCAKVDGKSPGGLNSIQGTIGD